MKIQDQDILVEKLKRGDKESYYALYDSYKEKIYNLAYRMLGNKQDADDITQETFIQTFRTIKSFQGNSLLYTWMYTIARNLCYRSRENKKRSSFVSMEMLIQSVQSKNTTDGMSEFEKQFYIDQVKEGCLAGLLRCLSFYQRKEVKTCYSLSKSVSM